jgi:hypothetical protein
MRNSVLILVLSISVSSAFAGLIYKDVRCIAADGLELSVPGGAGFYMQPIDLKNDYNGDVLAGLISRHSGQKTTDKNLRMNITMGNCKLNEDLSLSCDDTGFGSASYGYSSEGDYVMVNTPVQGSITLKLARDAKGVFQLALKLTNNKIKGGVLVIKKEIGPLSDPTQTSLTPWSPGCLFSDPQNN